MKYLSFVAVVMLSAAAGWAADRANLAAVKTVYLLPMGNGLDQYLANHLTVEGVFRVTTDPARADAFLTDRLGEAFEDRLEELLPEPPKKAEEPPKKGAEAKKGEEPKKTEDAVDAAPTPVVGKGFGSGKGNVYLVGRETRAVVWSTFARPKDLRAASLDAVAKKIVERLKKDLEEKPAK